MKQFSFTFLLIVLSTVKLLAQYECGTPAPAPPSWIFGIPATSQQRILQSSNADSYTLNIYVHIVRSNSGAGLNASISSSIISLLNTNFLGSRIQFNLLGYDYINDNNYYNDCSKKESQLCVINNKQNAINIYVLGTSTVWNYEVNQYTKIPIAGQALSIPSTSLILHGNSYNSLTLPHEMGHCLGLFHTFHGTCTEIGYLYTVDTNQCQEWVNGNNSGTCGDYIPDTPADPNKWSNCTYNGSERDANGDSYRPDPQNMMSYSGNSCRSLFTTMQSERMRNFILNTPALQNAIHHEVSGPSQICNQGAYIIDNLPAGTTVVWSVSPSGVVSLQPSDNSVMLTKVGNNRIALSANVNNSYTLTKYIWVGPPYISSIYGPTVVCYTEENGYGANVEGEQISYNWTIPGIARAVDDNYNSDVIRLVWDQYVESADFSLSVCNECGTAERTIQITMPLSCWYYYNSYFSLSPNPATTSAMLTINDIQDANVSTNANLLSKSTANKLTSVNEVYSVKVTNSFGLQVYTAKKYGKSFSIPVDNLANGIYVVEITSGKGSYRKQLVVKH